MIETIQQNGLWHLTLAYHNLIDQGGISEEDLGYELINLTYKKRKVVISHIYNEHLVVSLEGEDNEDTKNLMNAFSKVVEYQPFCKYNLKLGIKNISLPTYEWDKIDSEGRFRELKEKKKLKLIEQDRNLKILRNKLRQKKKFLMNKSKQLKKH